MNSTIAILLVFVAMVAAAKVAKSNIAQITEECAVAHSISTEQLALIRATKDKSTIQTTDNLKCFTKCAIDKGNFILLGTGIDVEHLVKVGVAHGKDEAKLRVKIDKCKSLYGGLHTCDESWTLYTCFFGQ